jgi:hypothetical protein
MKPEDEFSDPPPSDPTTDAELFDTAFVVEGPDDGAIDNPNAET